MDDRLTAIDRRSVTGAIVAGGQNTRFAGQPKGLLTVGGVRIIDRVAAALRAVASDLVLVANDPDANRWLPGVPAYRDERNERASLVGLATSIKRAKGAVLVVAWDMPFVVPELLRLISSQLAPRAAAVVPEGPRGLEPMCALYTRQCLPIIERALDRDELRLGSLVTQLPGLVRIPLERVSGVGDPARLFFNVNSPADLELAERLARTA